MVPAGYVADLYYRIVEWVWLLPLFGWDSASTIQVGPEWEMHVEDINLDNILSSKQVARIALEGLARILGFTRGSPHPDLWKTPGLSYIKDVGGRPFRVLRTRISGAPQQEQLTTVANDSVSLTNGEGGELTLPIPPKPLTIVVDVEKRNQGMDPRVIMLLMSLMITHVPYEHDPREFTRSTLPVGKTVVYNPPAQKAKIKLEMLDDAEGELKYQSIGVALRDLLAWMAAHEYYGELKAVFTVESLTSPFMSLELSNQVRSDSDIAEEQGALSKSNPFSELSQTPFDSHPEQISVA